MILAGAVTADREAIVPIRLRGPSGVEAVLKGVVDTGFSEALTLSSTWVTALGLTRISSEEMILADGSRVQVAEYEVTLLWNGQQRDVFAHCMEGSPLIGMSLLLDHLLTMEVVDGGPVTVDPIP